MEQYPFQGLRIGSILRDRSIVGRRQMQQRRSHGFIIKLQGATEYCAGDQVWLLEAGQILFVPKDSSYFIREVEPGYSYVVNFDCESHPAMQQLPVPTGMDISQPAEKLYHCWQKSSPYAAAAELYRLLDKISLQQYVSPTEKQLLEPVLSHLQQHLTDPDLDVTALADLADVSQVYLRRIFKKQYGVSPAGFVIRQRLQLAMQLLGENRTVAQVAAAVGYRDPLYFSRLFKKQLGLSPSAYRQEHRNDLF